jgi:hypothetical protein
MSVEAGYRTCLSRGALPLVATRSALAVPLAARHRTHTPGSVVCVSAACTVCLCNSASGGSSTPRTTTRGPAGTGSHPRCIHRTRSRPCTSLRSSMRRTLVDRCLEPADRSQTGAASFYAPAASQRRSVQQWPRAVGDCHRRAQSASNT